MRQRDVKKRGKCREHKKLREIRKAYIIEMAIRGYTDAEISKQLVVSEFTIRMNLKEGILDGTADKVRDALSKTLSRVPDVYNQIFDASPEDLQKNAKGYGLKHEAAKTLAAGLGTFKQGTQNTTRRLNLTAYHDQRQRLTSPDDTIDGSVVPPALPEHDETA